jgi:hypothetical protein
MANEVTPDFNRDEDYIFMVRHYDEEKEARAFKMVVLDDVFDKVGIEVSNLKFEGDQLKYDAEIVQYDEVLAERLPERFEELTPEKFSNNIRKAIVDHLKRTAEELESAK